MPEAYIKTIAAAAFAYIFGLALARLAGRKTMSQLTFFDFVLGVTLGTVTANMALGPNRVSASLVLIVFVALTVLTDYLHIKSFALRKLVDSEPVVVINNGKINENNLRRVRLTSDELQTQLRQKNIFNISDVEFAVMETNGKVSVLPKSQKQPLTPADIKVPTSYKGLTKDIVIDGHIMQDNLNDAHLDESWLKNTLLSKGIKNVTEVFYAGLDSSGNLYVSEKRKAGEHEGQYGIE